MQKMRSGRNPSPPADHDDLNYWSNFSAQKKQMEIAISRLIANKKKIASNPNFASLEFIKQAINRSMRVKIEDNRENQDGDEVTPTINISYEDLKNKLRLNDVKPQISGTSDENRDDDKISLRSKELEIKETTHDSKYPSNISGKHLEYSNEDSSKSKIQGRRNSGERSHRKKGHREKKKRELESKKASSIKEKTYKDELEEYKRESLKSRYEKSGKQSKSYSQSSRRRRYSSNSSTSSLDYDRYKSYRRDRRSRSLDRVSRRKLRDSSCSSNNSTNSYRRRSYRRTGRRSTSRSRSRGRSISRGRVSRSRSIDRLYKKKIKNSSYSSDNNSEYSCNSRSRRRGKRRKPVEDVSQNRSVTSKLKLHNDGQSDSNSNQRLPQDLILSDIKGLSVRDLESDSQQSTRAFKMEEGQCLDENSESYPLSPYDEEFPPGIFFSSGTFYCKLCQIHLNGEVCYETHLNGKRHKKVLEKAQQRAEIPPLNKNPEIHSKEPLVIKQEEPVTAPVIKNGRAMYQDKIEEYHDNPVPGLEFLDEIHNSDGTISYFCNLCEAPCVQTSIFLHLIGFRHYLKFLKIIDPVFYDRNKHKAKREICQKVKSKLNDYERRFGRQLIKVKIGTKKEFDPSSSDVTNGFPIDEKPRINPKDYQDASGNYVCKTCDCSMNNENMLISHMNGKRHLKNVKKTSAGLVPTIPISSKKEKDPYAHPRLLTRLEKWVKGMLESELENPNETSIVGLDFIRETQNEAGEIYNCYICNVCCSQEIIDHIMSLKHRINFLETVNGNKSIENAIEKIKELELGDETRWTLILEECKNIEEKYGRGTVEVYR